MDDKKDLTSLKGKTVDELKEMLDREIDKTSEKADTGLMEALVYEIIEAKGLECPEIDVKEKLAEFKKRVNSENVPGKRSITVKHSKVKKIAAAAAVFCMILAGGNAYTVSAHSTNVFSYVVRLTKGGAVIDLHDDGRTIFSTTEDDPYGMFEKCKESEINVDLPTYIPAGFVLKQFNEKNEDDYKYMFFKFENQEKFITITVYNNIETVNMITEKQNIQEIIVNGHSAVLSKEDRQSNLIYINNNFAINIFTQDVDYGECEGIFKSIKNYKTN